MKILLPKAFAIASPAPYILETRLKCLRCHHSFGLKYTFDRHVLQSHGRCVDSYPVRTNYTTERQHRRLVEDICTPTNNVHVSPSPLPYNRLKCRCCGRSYYKPKNFNRHVRQSKGRCSSSVSVSTAYFETADGKLVEIGVPNTAAPKIMSSILEATQLSNDDPLTPLILPTFFQNPFLGDFDVGMGEPFEVEDPGQCKNYYEYLKTQYNSNRRKREFVLGALYKKLIGNCHIIDCSANPGERVELKVKVEGTENVSTVTIANLSHETELTQSVVALGTQLPKRGTVRHDAGDVGDMWGLGYKNKRKQTTYALTKKVKEEMRRVSLNVMKYMGEEFAEAIDSIQTAEKKFPSPPCYEMGGENGPGSCIMISRNLGNSAHIDFMDGSLSLAIWVEEEVGSASNWYFILPNVQYEGCGVAVKLFHGCAISWDGLIIKHCTSITTTSMKENGDDNNVFGCMFGSCRIPEVSQKKSKKKSKKK